MAIFEVNLYAISNNADLHTTLLNKMEGERVSGKVWTDDYSVVSGVDEAGVPTTFCSVRFNDAANRTAVLNWINGLAGFKADCEIGSYVKYHKCFHDEKLPCEAPVTLWEKT